MAVDPSIRPAEPDDVDRLSELAERSMTTSYDLRPQAIEAIVSSEFGADVLAEKVDDPAVRLLVAERDDETIGFAEGVDAPREGTVRWIHVDPDVRGQGVGESLFAWADAVVGADDAGSVRTLVFADNAEGRTFIEHLGFEQTGERQVEIGGRQFLEYVYVDGSIETESDPDRPESTTPPANQPPATDTDLPSTTDTDEGTVFLSEHVLAGTEGAFARVYTDHDRTEPYGYYCGNCTSTDVSMDSMERLRCSDCGNLHKSDTRTDASYL